MRAAALLLLCGAGCGDEEGREEGPETGALSLLGASPASYAEKQEATNAGAAGAEATGYVLESDQGLRISGSTEAASPSADSFRFNSGSLGTAKMPGFPGVDMQLVIDGQPVRSNEPLWLSLDTVAEKGYSSLSGGSYFSNAALIRGEDYVVRVGPLPVGTAYVLEIRGHVPTP